MLASARIPNWRPVEESEKTEIGSGLDLGLDIGVDQPFRLVSAGPVA
jgi:hypothetical protein